MAEKASADHGFEILSEIRDIETIAAGRGVTIRRYLERTYGKGRWRNDEGYGNGAASRWYNLRSRDTLV
jgi:hypothetical protein